MELHTPNSSTTSSPSAESADRAAFYFDEAAADLACAFFDRYLVHIEGERAGQPFALEDWQRNDIIRPMFGWKRVHDGLRRYRIVYVEIPRKNGKSTLAAGIALALTFIDKEHGAQVFSAAADRDQASVVFNAAMSMRNANAELRNRSLAYKRSLVVPAWASSYRVLSSDAGSKHGLNAHGIIFDELHVQRDRDLYDTLHTSTGSRRQPLEVLLTTAGYDKHSMCWDMHQHARQVIGGQIQDDSFLGVIYAAGAEDDWTQPATWYKANPNLGVSISVDYLTKECERARQMPAYENTFKRLHLNLWTEQSSRWLAIESWDACDEVVDEEDLDGMECCGGLDLSSVSDLTALLLDFKREDGKHVWLARFWMPRDNIKLRVTRDRVPYDQWVKNGLIKATEGNVVDYDVVRNDINALAERFHIKEIAIDRWNATQITTQLQGDGFTVIAFGQGFASMSAPTKELEKLVLGKQLVHNAHPVLRWMASNVAVTQDPAGNLKPAKDKSGEKIDGIVAGVMALARSIGGEKETIPGFAEL